MSPNCIILGSGESGKGAAMLASKMGLTPLVIDENAISQKAKDFFNSKNIAYREKFNDYLEIKNVSPWIKSPGIPRESASIRFAEKNGLELISEIEFAYPFAKGKVIAITGTNGKTTTSLLTAHLLKESGFKVNLSGNIGNSFSQSLLNEEEFDVHVIEVSSFQLEDIKKFKPDIAILLNITPDHLDRYENQFEKYVDAKFKITKNLDRNSTLIYNADDETIAQKLNNIELEAKTSILSESFYQDNKLSIPSQKENLSENPDILFKNSNFLIENLPLYGAHNALNISAAATTCLKLSISENKIKQALSTFKPVPHRLEKIDTINGIDFINDSKATNVEATLRALESFQKPIIWIAGGVDKGNNYEILKDAVSNNVKAIVCLGIDNQKIIHAFKENVSYIFETKQMSEAIDKAYQLAEKGEVVLLSPACASFDLFKNFEDRGNQFREYIENNLKKLDISSIQL